MTSMSVNRYLRYNLSNWIREKDKGKRSRQTTNFRGDSEAINPSNYVFRKTCVVSDRFTLVRKARVPKCCIGSCRFSLSLPAEFQSVVSKDLPSRFVSQSYKVLCRNVSLVVLELSSRVPWCIIAC